MIELITPQNFVKNNDIINVFFCQKNRTRVLPSTNRGVKLTSGELYVGKVIDYKPPRNGMGDYIILLEIISPDRLSGHWVDIDSNRDEVFRINRDARLELNKKLEEGHKGGPKSLQQLAANALSTGDMELVKEHYLMGPNVPFLQSGSEYASMPGGAAGVSPPTVASISDDSQGEFQEFVRRYHAPEVGGGAAPQESPPSVARDRKYGKSKNNSRRRKSRSYPKRRGYPKRRRSKSRRSKSRSYPMRRRSKSRSYPKRRRSKSKR